MVFYKDKDIINYWKNFTNVFLVSSIDSWGDRAEYMRKGTKWDQLITNINRI